MLKKYEGNLEEHLNNEDIMRNLAKILRVGALFRLGIYQLASGVSIKFDVVGENGKTVFFSRYTVIEEFDDEYITELLLGWILAYKKSLPLSGKVVQIRGKTLLIDIPSGLVEGSKKEFKVFRPKSFRYEDVGGNRKLTWKKDVIAYGEILRVKKLHSIGNIFKFEDKNNKVREGDWIFIEDLDFNIKEEWYLQKIHNLKNERGIGRAKVSTEVTRVATKGNSETIIGVGLAFDLYLPAGFLFSGEVVRNISGGDQSISNNNLTAALGYSFTPRLYSDYFSFVDLYLGYRTLNYQIANFDELGIGDLKYSGLFLGAKVEVPIYKKFSLQFQANYIPIDEVENSNDLFGSAETSQAFDALITGKYKYDDSSRLFVEFHQRIHSSNFKSKTDDVNLSLTASMIKLGYGLDF
jgi:hypothetical protein